MEWMLDTQHGLRLSALRREDIAGASRLAAEAFGNAGVGEEVRSMLTLHCDSAGDTPLEQQQALLATCYYVLAQAQEGAIVGLTGLYHPAWIGQGVFGLGWFCLSPALRGQGIGERLLNATMQLAVAQGGRRLYIETSPHLTAALGLYRKMGFEENGKMPDYFGPGTDLLLLSRSLEDIALEEGYSHGR
jgi:ribosomal protein S18 acetylase RimI-like enzyme